MGLDGESLICTLITRAKGLLFEQHMFSLLLEQYMLPSILRHSRRNFQRSRYLTVAGSPYSAAYSQAIRSKAKRTGRDRTQGNTGAGEKASL